MVMMKMDQATMDLETDQTTMDQITDQTIMDQITDQTTTIIGDFMDQTMTQMKTLTTDQMETLITMTPMETLIAVNPMESNGYHMVQEVQVDKTVSMETAEIPTTTNGFMLKTETLEATTLVIIKLFLY